MQMPQKYDAKAVEEKWKAQWEKDRIYSYDPKSNKPVYSIDTPPPYVSADHLHVGHAMHYSQFEFVARYKRMRGFNVYFPMGFDDNGLPTERFVEKKHKVDKNSITRPDFVKLCLQETQAGIQTYKKLWTDLGISVDWDQTYSTIGKRAQRVSQLSFLDLFEKGRLVQEDAPTSWCPKCQTSIAQADFENVEMSSHFNDIIFKTKGKDMVISTTRPELLPACVGLFYHPDDDRYSGLSGKFASVPLFGFEVPILEDPSVEKDKGTGLMMCCTFGDKDDIEKWYRHDLPLRIVFTEDGKMTGALMYDGMSIKEARARIIEDLANEGLLIHSRKITHPVNVHERCGTEVEFLKKKQWMIRVLDKKEELLAIADTINWYPSHMKVRYQHWVQNLNWNWNISRQRYYGVPFPVWYSKKTGQVILPDVKQLPVDPSVDVPCTLPKGHTAEDIEPELDVMDTWMTSSCTPLIASDWDAHPVLYPSSLRPQAHDIIRTWAFYTIAKSLFHHGSYPWKDIMISGHGQDPKGRKMSKSLGNFITADEVMAKYSADALRYWSASVKLGEDLPFMEKDVQTGQKTITKLWNASRFALLHLEGFDGEKPPLHLIDRWLLSRLDAVIDEGTKSFDAYEYSKTKGLVDNFFWNTFCDQYLEIVKDRLYNPDLQGLEAKRSAQYTLRHALTCVLQLFAPFMPFVTEEIWQSIGPGSIHQSSWPVAQGRDEQAQKIGDAFVEVVSAVRKAKSEKNLSLKVPLARLVVSDELRPVLADLKAVTGAQCVEFGEFSLTL